MKLFTPLLLILFIAPSCSNSNSNGPCEWHERKFRATVTSVKFDKLNEAGDSTFAVIMEFDAGSLSEEPQNLAKLKNYELTSERMKKNKIKEGLTYTGKINDLKAGNCETPIVAFDQRMK